jgi:hypothetical protein
VPVNTVKFLFNKERTPVVLRQTHVTLRDHHDFILSNGTVLKSSSLSWLVYLSEDSEFISGYDEEQHYYTKGTADYEALYSILQT